MTNLVRANAEVAHRAKGRYFPRMTSLPVQPVLMSVEEFLEAEPGYDVKHEFLGGVVYAMAGASTLHNEIATNLIVALGTRLRGKPCKPFGSDMKVKINISDSTYFYYPDAMIVCNRAGMGASWSEKPAVIFEILSDSTRRIDEREKWLAYLFIPGLAAYVLIEQNSQRVLIEHRVEAGWNREVIAGPDAIVKLPSVDVEFLIAELYARVGE